MGKLKARHKAELSVKSPTESSVVSVTSPYFNDVTTDGVKARLGNRRSRRASTHALDVEKKPKSEEVLVENGAEMVLCKDSRRVNSRPKTSNAAELSSQKKNPVFSKMDDINEGSPVDQEEQYHSAVVASISSGECAHSEDTRLIKGRCRRDKEAVRSTKKRDRKCCKKNVTSEGTISPLPNQQNQECAISSPSVENIKPPNNSKRKRGNLRLFSEFSGNSLNEVGNSSPVSQEDRLNESDDEDWEDVDEKELGEVDAVKALLEVGSKAEPTDANKLENDETLIVSVPLRSTTHKSSCRDPAAAEAQARNRLRKELYSSMHVAHVLCYLAFSRSFNKICDSVTYRALGFSLLGNVASIFSAKGLLLELEKWTTDHLSSCLSVFLAHSCADSAEKSCTQATIFQRVVSGTCSAVDCALLFVSALRVINFDTRLVIGLTPISIKPPVSTEQDQPLKCDPPKKIQEKQNTKVNEKINRKIISSDESDFEPVSVRRPRKYSPQKTADPPKYYIFAEVFLPKLNRWVCIDFCKPLGSVDKIPKYSSMFYVIGMTTTLSDSSDTQPYVGRNPVDLASRYDPDWCIQSRLHRLPAERWMILLNYQRLYFDTDAARNNSLVARTGSLSTEIRDRTDEDGIRSELLAKPMPEKMQDFKNHPLYVMQRHLLKFEVIHPPDALPLGFFRGEPIYSRDCLHVCHTRESWLREAKVVKEFEKPAKVVKARASLKRMLLQGSDPAPPMVDIFGSWQVEDYKPPVAQNGVVPRNMHGTIDLFKPCMLPIGCAHLCLTGIQHIAKKLGIDCAPAVIGWKFHGLGWAIPIVDGYVVCKETVPALLDAWRSTQMDAVKAAAQERSDRALNNWRRLVRGLFLWHRIKAQFALAPLHPEAPEAPHCKPTRKRPTRKSDGGVKLNPLPSNLDSSLLDSDDLKPHELGSLTVSSLITNEDGWQRLVCGENSHQLPIFPGISNTSTSLKKEQHAKQLKASRANSASRGISKGRRKRKKCVETSTEKEDTAVTSESD